MRYVIAGYVISLVSLAAYAVSLVVRRRRLGGPRSGRQT